MEATHIKSSRLIQITALLTSLTLLFTLCFASNAFASCELSVTSVTKTVGNTFTVKVSGLPSKKVNVKTTEEDENGRIVTRTQKKYQYNVMYDVTPYTKASGLPSTKEKRSGSTFSVSFKCKSAGSYKIAFERWVVDKRSGFPLKSKKIGTVKVTVNNKITKPSLRDISKQASKAGDYAKYANTYAKLNSFIDAHSCLFNADLELSTLQRLVIQHGDISYQDIYTKEQRSMLETITETRASLSNAMQDCFSASRFSSSYELACIRSSIAEAVSNVTAIDYHLSDLVLKSQLESLS